MPQYGLAAEVLEFAGVQAEDFVVILVAGVEVLVVEAVVSAFVVAFAAVAAVAFACATFAAESPASADFAARQIEAAYWREGLASSD